MEGHTLNIAMFISQCRQRQEDALLRPGLLRDQCLHGKPRPIPLDRFPFQPGHVPVFAVFGQHDLAGAGHHAFLPYTEDVLFRIVEQLTDDPEKDVKLIRCLLDLLEGREKQAVHIVAKLLKHLRPSSP